MLHSNRQCLSFSFFSEFSCASLVIKASRGALCQVSFLFYLKWWLNMQYSWLTFFCKVIVSPADLTSRQIIHFPFLSSLQSLVMFFFRWSLHHPYLCKDRPPIPRQRFTYQVPGPKNQLQPWSRQARCLFKMGGRLGRLGSNSGK